jgi:hypothetical protein
MAETIGGGPQMSIFTSAAGAGHHSYSQSQKPRVDARKGRVESYLDHVRGDETNTTSPTFRGVVENIVYPNVIVLGGQLIQILLQQNVFLVDVGKDEINLRPVLGVLGDGTDDLKHGGNPGAAGNHTKVAHHVRGVLELPLWPADLDGLSDFEGGNVLGDVASGVGFDEQGEGTAVVVRRDGSVGADDFFAVDGGGDRDVLADRKTEDRVFGGEIELVAAFLSTKQALKAMGLGGEHTWRRYGR